MTNIACTQNCIYQKDGICAYDEVTASKINSDNECIYYTEESPKKEKLVYDNIIM